MSKAEDATAPSGRRIAYHSLLNLIGAAAPLAVALIAIPLLIGGLGTARFGVLTLVWVLIGYLSLLDLGIGRALTKVIAERLGRGEAAEVPRLIGTALPLMLLLGVGGGVVVALSAPWFVVRVLTVPAELQAETITAFRLVAFTLPAVTATTALRGVLEAYHRFELVNAIRVPMGVFTFAGPLLVLPVSQQLPAVVAVLLAGRIAAACVHWWLVRRVVKAAVPVVAWRWQLAGPLLRFGGWMTVSNALSPLMVYLDRFVIGALLGVTAVAYYATPYEIATKLWLVPAALLSVLFPAFSAGMHRQPDRMPRLVARAVGAILLLVAPITLLLVAFGDVALGLWIGEEFARNSAAVLKWLAIGVLINSLAQVPFTALQGAGRPDLTAKLHLLEVPLYLAILAWLTPRYGIEGAAIAWVLRVSLDAVLLFVVAARVLPGSLVWVRPTLAAVPAALAVTGAVAALPEGGMKLTVVAGALLFGLVASWLFFAGLRMPDASAPAR